MGTVAQLWAGKWRHVPKSGVYGREIKIMFPCALPSAQSWPPETDHMRPSKWNTASPDVPPPKK